MRIPIFFGFSLIGQKQWGNVVRKQRTRVRRAQETIWSEASSPHGHCNQKRQSEHGPHATLLLLFTLNGPHATLFLLFTSDRPHATLLLLFKRVFQELHYYGSMQYFCTKLLKTMLILNLRLWSTQLNSVKLPLHGLNFMDMNLLTCNTSYVLVNVN